jgi:hypothetical protein
MRAFLVSLVLAIALNPQRRFFLAIILLRLAIHGRFSRCTNARMASPTAAALSNALAFTWFTR